jgi:antitoxin MazE
VKTRIVRIGNSQGIRIPKTLLEAAGLEGDVDVTAKRGSLVVRPFRTPRAGWADACQRMAAAGDDALLDDVAPSLSSWDEEEWQW